MRVRVRLAADNDLAVNPAALHVAGRGVVYAALEAKLGDGAGELHERGMGDAGLIPFGFRIPTFPDAARRRAEIRSHRGDRSWVVGGEGFVEFGSPRQDLLWAIAQYVQEVGRLRWGGHPDKSEGPLFFEVLGVEATTPARYDDGQAAWETFSPVVAKPPTTAGNAARRQAEGGDRRYLTPQEDGVARFAAAVTRNAQRKAKTLELPPDVHISIDRVRHDKPTVRSIPEGMLRVGANIEVTAVGDPRVLEALWAWGLGESTAAGFGWIR